MGLLDRLLGKDFPALRAKADSLFEAGEHGLAKLEYEAALSWDPGDDAALTAELRARLAECRARLAEQRVTRAVALRENGHLDEAAAQYRDALDVLDDEARRDKVFAAIRDTERELAAEERVGYSADEAPEGGDFSGESVEGRFELHMLALDDAARADEYRTLGPQLVAAFVSVEDGEGAAAASIIREAFGDAPYESVLIDRELGRGLLLAEDFAGAVTHLDRYAEEVGTEDVPAMHALAEAQAAAGDTAGAVETLQVTIEDNPEAAATRMRLAELLIDQGDGAAATASLERAIEQAPGAIVLHRTLGHAREVAGDEAAAMAAYEQALALRWELDNDTGELDFDRISAWRLAQLLLKSDGDPQRILDLVRALDVTGDEAERPGFLLTMARAHQRLGAISEAREALITARTILDDGDAAGRTAIDEALAGLPDE